MRVFSCGNTRFPPGLGVEQTHAAATSPDPLASTEAPPFQKSGDHCASTCTRVGEIVFGLRWCLYLRRRMQIRSKIRAPWANPAISRPIQGSDRRKPRRDLTFRFFFHQSTNRIDTACGDESAFRREDQSFFIVPSQVGPSRQMRHTMLRECPGCQFFVRRA